MFRRLYKKLRTYVHIPKIFQGFEFVADLVYYLKYKKSAELLVVQAISPSWKSTKVDFRQDVNLVFFCGIGDALYGLPVMQEIKRRCKENGTKINAFVSTTPSSANSKYLGNTLNRLEVFDGVYEYIGLDTEYWKYYQYENALAVAERRGIGGKFYPYIYRTNSRHSSRTEAVAAQFRIKNVETLKPPITVDLSKKAQQLLSSIKEKCVRADQYVFLCHFDTRSGEYRYGSSDEVIHKLLEQGHIVLSPESTIKSSVSPDADNLFILDNSIDLISLGRILHETGAKVIAVNSVFWPLSHMYELETLGLHYLKDDMGYHFAHPKMYMMTPQINVFRRVKNSMLARHNIDYTCNPNNSYMIDFKPRFILDMAEFLMPNTKD